LDAQASSTYKTHRNWSAKRTKKNVQNHAKCAQIKKALFWMPRQAPLAKRTKLECEEHKNVQNHAKRAQILKKHFCGCPGKLHLQNAQKLECKKHKKNMQNHAKCAQIKKHFFGCPSKPHLQNAQKLECKKHKNVHKKNTCLDAQASSTYKTHRTWSVKSTKMCNTMHNEQKKII